MKKSPLTLLTALLFIFSSMSPMLLDFSSAEENNSYATDQLSNGGNSNDTMPAIVIDSDGNLHSVWVRNNQHLFYSMKNFAGQTLISDTQISNNNGSKTWHPDVAVDSMDRVHIVWADKGGQHSIVYTVLNPWLDDRDGSASSDGTLTVIEDTLVAQRAHNRDWPTLAIDSKDNVHIAWEDSYDQLDRFYQQPQIYYAMLEPDYGQSAAITVFDDTLLTPVIGHKGHPVTAIDSNDLVTVSWDDTRGSEVELVFIVDTSGSMYSEWADLCTLIYGGSFSSGGSFQGLKPMLEQANITVYETLYGLGNSLPGAASSGDCANHNQNAGPRNTPLGLVSGDDSGGIRKLPGTVYNGATYTGYTGEDWGPGSNWACLSYMDANGNVPGNPPTSADHKWNPNAARYVIPLSDEGPKDGDPAGQSDDHASIVEAHDNCITAGVIPVGLYGQSWGGASAVQSHFRDLAQCSDGVQGTHTRSCPGTTLSNSDAGGQIYEFPEDSTSSQMQLLIEALVYHSTNHSREIYMTILDPYGKINNDPEWVSGESGHSIANGSYTEDTGLGTDGHLVVVNDTRMTNNKGYSYQPSMEFDSFDKLHLSWMDGRDHGTRRDVSYEIYYAKYDLYSDGPFDGRREGLNVDNLAWIEETVISNVESNLSSPFAGHSAAPKLSIDVRDNIHIVWVDYANNSSIEEIIHTRLNSTINSLPGNATVLDAWELETITTWYSNKVGKGIGEELPVSELPAVSSDLGSGVHIAWSDNFSCADKTLKITFSICHTHVSTGSVSLKMRLPDVNYRNLTPGQSTYYHLTLNNTTPGPAAEVAATYLLGLSGIPTNWSTELFFATNLTAINNTTPLWLNGGESMDLFLKVTTPSVFIANQDEIAEIEVSASSIEDQGISSSLVTWTSMDVVHGIKLNTLYAEIEIEQDQTAIFSIAITNSGNVHDSFAFYDSNTLEGQQEWMLPFGWSVDFPTEVELNPGQSTAKNLKVEIPISQEPGIFVLYVKGWSVGEPIKDIAQGTYDVLELFISVRLITEGNIIIEQSKEKMYILPQECLDIDYHITKHYQSGSLRISASIDQADWNTTFDWSNAPVTNSDGLRYFSQDQRYRIGLEVCAPASLPENESATITFTATLDGASYVTSNSIIEVIHYRAPTVEISQPIKNSTVEEMTLFIYGNVSGQQRSGETTVSISLNENEFNQEWHLTSIYKAAKTFDDAVFYVQGSFQFELFLLTKVSNGTGPITIYLQTCDQRTCYLDEFTIIWFQDIDGDGWGDGEDVFPFDPSEWRDSDGDGFGDNRDKFPNDASEFEDTDGDGVGDWRDEFPNDPSEYVDTDGDGVGDNADEFPLDFNEWFDSDGDGVGDNSDYRPFDPLIQSKSDLNSKTEDKSSTTTGLNNRVLLSIGGVALILIILVVILLASTPKRKEDLLTSYDSSFDLIEENEWLPIPHNETFFPTPVEQTLVEPQPVLQPDPVGINQLLPPSGPPAPPVASIPSNNGIRDGYEWLATNGLEYYRPTGSMTEWQRWN